MIHEMVYLFGLTNNTKRKKSKWYKMSNYRIDKTIPHKTIGGVGKVGKLFKKRK